jgi:hypothetical protein
MKLTTFLLVVSMCVSAQAQRGTVPLESAEQYPIHAAQPAVGVGVRLLTQAEAHKTFSVDLNHCCLVVEVALFPQKDGAIAVSLDDFVMRTKSKSDELSDRPFSPEAVVAALEKKPELYHPEEGTDDRAGVHHTTGIGYESTRVNTPNGKESSHGVILSTGTSVGVGVGGQRPGPDDRNRHLAETELRAKGLPEGQLTAPIAGYLYFPLPSKKDKKAERQLEYWVNGERIVLRLP